MISLRWGVYDQADVISFKIYRSMIGFSLPKSGPIGKTIQLKINNQTLQTFTLGMDNLAMVNQTIKGGRAFLSHDGLTVLVRSDLRENPGFIQIVGGTALADLGQQPRIIGQQSEDSLIGTIVSINSPQYEYCDPDGVCQDYYRISTTSSSGDESRKSSYKQPVSLSGPICVIEGVLTNIQGARVTDVDISIKVELPPEKMGETVMTNEPVVVQSGTDGRFSIPVLQGAVVRIEIPSIGMSQSIKVPELPYANLNDIMVDTSSKFRDDIR